VYYYNFQSFTKVYSDDVKINAIAVNPAGSQFAVGNNSGEIRLMSPDKTTLHTLQLKEAITALSFSNDGRLLAIGTYRPQCPDYQY
jgi:WD40 repeat protein